jgi:5-methylcytosine-specific restriction endonuclease McrA
VILKNFFQDQWRALQRKASYNAYLKSWQWQHIRKIKMQFAGDRCEKCGAVPVPTNPLDVHHLTYARFGHENLTDLQVLCRRCHKAAHSRTFTSYPERDMYIEYKKLDF